jgi:hypothetical protein
MKRNIKFIQHFKILKRLIIKIIIHILFKILFKEQL